MYACNGLTAVFMESSSKRICAYKSGCLRRDEIGLVCAACAEAVETHTEIDGLC